MSSVCEHATTGVKAYFLYNGQWTPVDKSSLVRLQLFFDGTLLLRSQDGGDVIQDLKLVKGSAVQRHNSESHSNCCEVNINEEVYLLKFPKETDCAQFVTKARKHINPTKNEHDFGYDTMPQRDPWENPVPQPRTFQHQRQSDRHHSSDQHGTQDGHYGSSFRGHVESGYGSGHLSGPQDFQDPFGEHVFQENPMPYPPRPPKSHIPGNQPGKHDYEDHHYYNCPADWTGGGHVKHHRPKDFPFGQESPRSHVPQGGPRGQRLFDHPRAHGSPVTDHPSGPKPSTSRDNPYPCDREVDKVIRENRSTKDMDMWMSDLAYAINVKNLHEAFNVVDQLIEYTHTVGEIDLQCKCIGADNNQYMRLNVSVECQHKDSQHTRINVLANKYWRMENLKAKVEQEYHLPRQVQKWIFGKQLVKDNDILINLVGNVEEARPFLYVVKAKKANLDQRTYESYMYRMDFQEQQQADYQMSRPTATMPPKARKPMTVKDSGTRSAGSVQRGNNRVASSTPEASVLRDPQVNDSRSVERGYEFRDADVHPVRPLQTPQHDKHDLSLPLHQDKEPSHPPIFGLDVPVSSPDEVVGGTGGEVGWKCPVCTLINKPMRPGCEACSTGRPPDYQPPVGYVPDESERELMRRLDVDQQELEKQREDERQRNLDDLMATDFKDYIENTEPFDCPICFDDCKEGDGIVIRNCLHVICKECFREQCINSEEAEVRCPFGGDYQCESFITEREMRGLLTEEEFVKIEQLGLNKAEAALPNTFHCRSADCPGWCIYEDEVNEFPCPICNKVNCLLCKAIHEGMNCKEYQDDITRKAANDEAAKATKQFMERMLQEGQAMECPSCSVVVQKKDGCDWIMCSVCRTELCWATKGARWGPKGKGDITGGCKCGVRGKKCTPTCRNCH